jgi:uncharacterized protein YycO
LVLDPADTNAAIDDPQPVLDVGHRHIRKFGFAPFLLNLVPGDLILVSRTRIDISSKLIRAYQRQFFSESLSQWTHVALYIGNGHIVHAVGKGVRIGHIHDYVPTHKIFVRRYKKLTTDKRNKMGLYACSSIGKKYQYAAMWQFLRAVVSTWTGTRYIGRKYTICSQLYADAFTYSANRTLTGVPLDGHATPAHLAACPDYVDIEMKWIRLAV